ncbi:hypothetical protein AK88_03559 [Plasmodium fragile]|uniref:Uncharacterized protein n=1 Tax=Plasmodium fragile TaxID=5857 RepID=A0A0D9QI52_PLAFR|nr:uncharacterized protein AK88_03559 [Plasmodium fragile]KJP86745.1 hypothetical protein AK88_03559 [Plasmodium fragile]
MFRIALLLLLHEKENSGVSNKKLKDRTFSKKDKQSRSTWEIKTILETKFTEENIRIFRILLLVDYFHVMA